MTKKTNFFEIIRSDHNFNFIGKSKFFIALSVILTLVSLVILPLNRYVFQSRGHWMKFSLDFGSGREATVDLTREISASEVRQALTQEGYGEFYVNSVTDAGMHNRRYLIKFASASVLSSQQKETIKTALKEVSGAGNLVVSFDEWGEQIFVRYTVKLPPGSSLEEKSFTLLNQAIGAALSKIEFIKVKNVQFVSAKALNEGAEVSVTVLLPDFESNLRGVFTKHFGRGVLPEEQMTIRSVGEKAGSDLRQNGIIALLAAIGFIMLYILARFDFRYAPGTVIALLHDALLVFGAFAVFYREFSLTTVAAILTVIGYSMNDTIVVFDRIRENASKMKDKDFEEVVNLSINETLSRTILTSLTVFFVTLAMNIFGTGVIRDFGFAMNIGVVVGTYSSIFVASPVLILLNKYFYKPQKKGSLSVV